MPDGRFDPEFYRALAGGQVSASDRPHEEEEAATHPVAFRVWVSVASGVALACLLLLA